MIRSFRCRWTVFRLQHAKLSLIWWSRCWRWKLVKRGFLPMPTREQGSPPLTPLDLCRLKLFGRTTEAWDRRHEDY